MWHFIIKKSTVVLCEKAVALCNNRPSRFVITHVAFCSKFDVDGRRASRSNNDYHPCHYCNNNNNICYDDNYNHDSDNNWGNNNGSDGDIDENDDDDIGDNNIDEDENKDNNVFLNEDL